MPVDRDGRFMIQRSASLGVHVFYPRVAAPGSVALAPLVNGERGVIVNTASVAAFEGRSARPRIRRRKAGSSP